MNAGLPKISVAQTLADGIVALKPGALPAITVRKCEDLLIDVVGLCVTARNEDYAASSLQGCDDDGPCTAIGHQRTLTAAGAAFVNGTAAHGEDFDDTFEGGPVHAGAVVVPAVLAACERHNPDGRMALIGIAVGAEVLCRLSLVVPKAVHKSGFHPTAIFGAMGAAAATGFVHGGVGLGAFTDSAIHDERVLALAAKVKFVIDPDNPYPNSYTGHIRAVMKDGSVIEERQPYLRGGAQEPLTRQDVTDKFILNAEHGGWSRAQSDAALKLMAGLYNGRIDLSSLRG